MILFAAMLALHLNGGAQSPPPAVTPTAVHPERTVAEAETQRALAFYQNLISLLETVDIDSRDAVSARLGLRFVRDPSYRRGGPLRGWLAMVPASHQSPMMRVEYLDVPGQRRLYVFPFGWHPTKTDFIAIYPAMRFRPDDDIFFFRSGPPDIALDIPGRGNEIRLVFGQGQPQQLRYMLILSRQLEPDAGPAAPTH